MPEGPNLILPIVFVTAIVIFSIGVVAFFVLLIILAATTDIMNKRTAPGRGGPVRSSIVTLVGVGVCGLGLGLFGFRFGGQGDVNVTAIALLVAGGLIALETISILLIFLTRIVSLADPQRGMYNPKISASINTEETIKQIVVVLGGGGLIGGWLLSILYTLNANVKISALSFPAKGAVVFLSFMAGVFPILASLLALFFLLWLAIVRRHQHRILPLWIVFGIGIVVGGCFIYLTLKLTQ